MRLVLASSSPRRRELLEAEGYEIEVRVPDIDERAEPGESPQALVERLAREKALAVAAADTEVVVAGDTVVVVAGEIIGKPRDAGDAVAILKRLSGTTHDVWSGFAVRRGGEVESGRVCTEVEFRTLTDGEIAEYVAGGEALDKAGAYGIQGVGGELVAEITGSYSNVVGLPVEEVVAAVARWRSGSDCQP